jgi:hypothetical protein
MRHTVGARVPHLRRHISRISGFWVSKIHWPYAEPATPSASAGRGGVAGAERRSGETTPSAQTRRTRPAAQGGQSERHIAAHTEEVASARSSRKRAAKPQPGEMSPRRGLEIPLVEQIGQQKRGREGEQQDFDRPWVVNEAVVHDHRVAGHVKMPHTKSRPRKWHSSPMVSAALSKLLL